MSGTEHVTVERGLRARNVGWDKLFRARIYSQGPHTDKEQLESVRYVDTETHHNGGES